MVRNSVAPASPPHAWILDLLYENPCLATWSAAGQLPPGYNRAEQFVILPAGSGRNFGVSLGSRRGAAAAVTAYNGLRPARRRAERLAVGAALRTGLAQRVLSAKIDVGNAVGATEAQLSDAVLGWYLRDVLGGGPLVFAFGAGTGPYRKPVLQVFSGSGAPVAYVKIGWNDWTRDAVRREAEALRACASVAAGLGAPRLLHSGPWQDLELLVTAPLPAQVQRVASDRPVDPRLIRDISAISTCYAAELGSSPWWAEQRTRITRAGLDPVVSARLSAVADGIERTAGERSLDFGRWHGDLVPWNLASYGGRFYAWDWESSSPSAPVGLDALHYHFQIAFVAERRSLAEAVAAADAAARPVLADLGAGQPVASVLGTLHLLDLAIRHEEARASTGDSDDRFYPAVLDLLEARGRAAVPDPDLERAA